MREEFNQFDLCVVGGGLAGLIAAVSAARRGTRVALVQDRPVLGGNCSSEIRMHVCGAHGRDTRETGLLEELLLDNFRYNSTPTYALWDSVLYGKAQYTPGLTLFLNCSVNSATLEGKRLKSVRAWQLTTETWHTLSADLFADCSGDGILIPLTGADHRIGREGREEFGESIAPLVPDRRTMGMSCLQQAREHDTPQPFVAPPWAHSYTEGEHLRGRGVSLLHTNFWWMEVGGEDDSIHDTERCREELLRISLGVWNYIKNHSPDKEAFANFALDWQGFLPGKRESRRYYGDHILTQHDIEAGGPFKDTVAYGGWSMDDHFPAGFYHPKAGTIFHPAPSPYGIPYRSLYSRNIANLFCAGRCHSATHSAMSSTRVMGTTSLMGQAMGTAAALAVRHGLSPRGVYEQRLGELQQTLMDDDCWLPGLLRAVPELARAAKLSAAEGDVEALRNGMERPSAGKDNGWTAALGTAAEYRFAAETAVSQARITFDSNLERKDPSRKGGEEKLRNMRYFVRRGDTPFSPPETLVRNFRLEGLRADGAWETIARRDDNFQRLVRVKLKGSYRGVRLVPETTWGSEKAHVFAFDVA
jgi:hypothetical protein